MQRRKKRKRTQNKQQYNNRIFLGLISSASAELQGKRLGRRCLLSIHYLVSSGAAATRHGIKHSSSRRPKECHHQSASALDCQSAAPRLFTGGSPSPSPSHPFSSFDLSFICVPTPCPFSAALISHRLVVAVFFLPPNDDDWRGKKHSDACLTKTHLSVLSAAAL